MAYTDPWHYHRRELTRDHLALLDSRLANAVVLFGPRRTGKTEFLLQDLGPGAQALGWKVAYASFWQSKLTPIAVLLHALTNANRRASLAERARALSEAVKPKLKLGVPIGASAAAEAEVDLSELSGPPSADLLLRLDDLIERFAARGRRALLMLDEVQELAERADNGPLVAALRTSIDKRRDRLAVYFTGSSQARLRAMFSRRDAPFFHFGSTAEWPPLDDEFVVHSLGVFAKVIGSRLDYKACLRAFHALDRNPYYFRKLLESLAFDPNRDVGAAQKNVRDRAAVDLRFPDTWRVLSALQREVALMLAQDKTKPFSKEAARLIGQRTGASAPTRAQIQAAIRALLRADIVSKVEGSGAYEFNDPEFARWIAARTARY